MFCVRRARGNHTPAARRGLRSSHGQTVSSVDQQPGQHDAADERAVDRERAEWIVVSVTISCSHRKYQGAFAGFGVTSALAGSSSGDAMNTARMLMTRDRAERDDQRAPREVGHRVDRRVRRLERARASPPARCRARRRAACRSWSATGAARAGVSSSASRSARARPPSLRTRHMWYANSTPSAGRQEDDVQHVEADQRRLSIVAAADQQLAHCRPDARNRRRDVGADGDRPERELVPRQQIAGEREEQREQQHHDADDPVPLALLAVADAVLVGAGEEHAHQVQEHRDDHQVRGDRGARRGSTSRT